MSNELQIEEGVAEEFVPQAEMVISNLETLKVAADPIRLRIMEVLTEKALTVKQVAHMLDTTPTKLYYHVNLLEEHGLITVTASRIVSGIIEKQYHTSGRSLRVDRSLLTINGEQSDEGVNTLLSIVFDTTRDDMLRGMRRGLINLNSENPLERNAILGRTVTKLTPEKYQEFVKRLKDLVDEFNATDADDDPDTAKGAEFYGLTLALYPFAHVSAEDEESET